jgi:hypothetical protein
MHNTLLDKFYHIVTTDEIARLPAFAYIHIINKLFEHTDKPYILFDNGSECKACVECMNYTLGLDCDAEEQERLNNIGNVDALCMLESYDKIMPDGSHAVMSDIAIVDPECEYDFVLEIMEDKILSKIKNLKKVLSKLLKNEMIRDSIKSHVIRNPLSIVED